MSYYFVQNRITGSSIPSLSNPLLERIRTPSPECCPLISEGARGMGTPRECLLDASLYRSSRARRTVDEARRRRGDTIQNPLKRGAIRVREPLRKRMNKIRGEMLLSDVRPRIRGEIGGSRRIARLGRCERPIEVVPREVARE